MSFRPTKDLFQNCLYSFQLNHPFSSILLLNIIYSYYASHVYNIKQWRLINTPLQYSSVESASRDETRVISQEPNARHVGRVTAVLVAERLRLCDGICVQLHFTEIVTGGHQATVVRPGAGVDVSAVSSLGPDADGGEGDRAGVGGPHHVAHRRRLRDLTARCRVPVK